MTANRAKPSPDRVSAISGVQQRRAKSLKLKAVALTQVEVPRQDEEALARQAKTVSMGSLYRVHYLSHRGILYWSCSQCRAEREFYEALGMEITREN